ncbi:MULTISPECIES: iron-containing alcohol dehydrogenase [unclassified Oceanispirochaeta]|uniref:iron-containing alcohol dehydrogenase n=1 Tax=unclassified Oceanispirochaeta TaxID=2635722 RepID=UPI000E09AAEF|nr:MULTISPECIES: iron-containing alcohol dehydrogenase [unclassified Oceanispirochaeta]MBF9016675.1 iron-containing alcohol dehydrogenase [Oceanispirochaeta sp. M2]NPD73120.1 iron-containing alcohol dehydrogenase [Oceanispirochaeta sp. M1]RDG31221.1 iron-containing alcohol dehydrogenase [Oceanispirochaeta sp. M1]
MFPFELHLPTKVVFGEGTINKIGEISSTFGKKAMLVSYDEDLIKSFGFYDKAVKSLNEANIEVLQFFGVKSNPTVDHVRKGIEVAKTEKPDVLIALGGGSVIDTVKAMAVGYYAEGDIWDMATGAEDMKDALPIIAVVTIPATSSEMNNVSVLFNDEIKRKEGFGSPLMYPKVAILDPELTYGLPIRQTAISAADVVSHLLEGYLNHNDPWAPMQDRYALGMIKTVIECMELLMKDPKDAQARATLMWVTTNSWNGFYVSGLGAFDASIHMIGHSFSAFYDTPHGAAMSVSIPAVMKYHLKDKIEKYSVFAQEVFGIEGEACEAMAEAGVDAIVSWFKRIGVPTSFKEADMPVNELDAMADDVLITAKNWGIESYTKEAVLEILDLCL